MGRLLNANEPVADDVEGHGANIQHNEPVAEDVPNDPAADDVEGHGLLRNAAIAAALTVGGGAAVAAPASASPIGSPSDVDVTLVSDAEGAVEAAGGDRLEGIIIQGGRVGAAGEETLEGIIIQGGRVGAAGEETLDGIIIQGGLTATENVAPPQK